VLREFFDNYYTYFEIPEDFQLKEKVSSATIQNLILKNLNDPNEVLKELQK